MKPSLKIGMKAFFLITEVPKILSIPLDIPQKVQAKGIGGVWKHCVYIYLNTRKNTLKTSVKLYFSQLGRC